MNYPIIAIGDLHGQTDFLKRLLTKLRALPEWDTATLVFLGDLVDRGPDPKGTVELVMQLLDEKPGSECVLGNHDLGFIHATGIIGPPIDYWVKRWGDHYDHATTFRSYLGREPQYHSFKDWLNDLQQLNDSVPQSHRNFLAARPWVVEAEGHLFLHNGLSTELDEPATTQLHLLKQKKWAGYVHPKIGTKSAANYTPHYPVWLGADKGLSDKPLPYPGKVQVTGHVRVDKPDVNDVRIRIDTSGGMAVPLTACLLRDASATPTFIYSDRAS